MHILFLTDNFPPEVNAPASRTFEHCKEWVNEGHEVTVVTCAPNFPNGRVFNGYQNTIRSVSFMKGIRVVRVWSYMHANEGLFLRLLDQISYMFSALVASLFVRKVDLIVGTSPQFFTVCAAFLFSKVRRIPWVFELRDLWPESIKSLSNLGDNLAIKLMEKLEYKLYRDADLIISVTNSFKEILEQRGIDPQKIKIVTNGVDLSKFFPRPKNSNLVKKYRLDNKVVIGYIGTIGMAHGLDTVLTAAKKLENIPGDYFFLLIGDGAEKKKLLDKARMMDLKNLAFIDTVSKEQVAQYWSLLDMSLIHLKKDDLFKTVIPSKIFESMAMGIPILLGVEGESAQIVESHKAGISFEPDNPEALLNAIIELDQNREAEDISSKCRNAASYYSRRELAMGMISELEGLSDSK